MDYDPTIESSDVYRNRVNTIRIGVGLFGAPIAWIAQVFLSESLAAHACYPYQTPVSAPIWEGLLAMLTTISFACFAVALLSCVVVWTSWRQSEPKSIGAGRDDIGTNRFLVKLSAMSNFIFVVAIIFNICAVFLVSPCSSWF